MKLSLLSFLAVASTAAADYVCPTTPSLTDAKALSYASTIQSLIKGYYTRNPVNSTMFSNMPNAQQMASNGKTMAENTATNVQGLTKQAMLASNALMMEMPGDGLLAAPDCNNTFMYPKMQPMNGTEFLMNAFHLEASLCGAFIGLADYFQTPELNSLTARIAAEHGIHASALRSMMQPVGFMPSSKSLTPVFTPEMVLSEGDEVGMLGGWLGGCITSGPEAPCGGEVSFGPLLSNLTDQNDMSQ